MPKSYHKGTLPSIHGMISLDAPDCVIDAVKMAESGEEAPVVHMHECARREAYGMLHIASPKIDVPLHFRRGRLESVSKISLD